MPTSKFVKSIEFLFVYGIILIPLVRCSFRCTLSLYNAFMWTISVKDGQSEHNGLRRNEGKNEQTMEQTQEGTNTSRDLLIIYIDCVSYRSVKGVITNLSVQPRNSF